MTDAMSNIRHVVVVMFENRSFDNMLGWLYADRDNRPPRNLPSETLPRFEGLAEGQYWNPENRAYFAGAAPRKVHAIRRTRDPEPFRVPDHDPEEGFDHITFQLFGTSRAPPGQEPTMDGFVVDYGFALTHHRLRNLLIFVFRHDLVPIIIAASALIFLALGWLKTGSAVGAFAALYILLRVIYFRSGPLLFFYLLMHAFVRLVPYLRRAHEAIAPKPRAARRAALAMPDIPPAKARASHRIMEGFDPAQVSVLSGLATSYAVCDHWFASVPAQTMPNRAFVHAGTSCGNVNNPPAGEFNYDAKTIFNVLEENAVSWAIYSAGDYPSFARLQMQSLWDPVYDHRFLPIERFLEDAERGRLPAYSFIEPTFFPEYPAHAGSQHPPSDVRAGEEFLDHVWQALRASSCWERLVLVITYDEHGGCYDHVPPPWGATPPTPEDANGNPEGFAFDRFGARVPTVLVSPYIEAGTVFRRPEGEVPYDHTSIIATVLDWQGLDRGVLGSERVNRAPSFAEVLTRDSPRRDRPAIRPASAGGEGAAMLRRPVGSLHQGLVVAASHFHDYRREKGGTGAPRRVKQLQALARAPTQQRAAAWLSGIRDAIDSETRAP